MMSVWRERLRDQRRNPAQRRYVRRFLPLMLLYSVSLPAVSAAADAWRPGMIGLVLLALLPTLPLLGTLVVMGLYLAEERDEFVRDRLITAVVGGIGLLLALLTVWGFLELEGLVPHFPTFLAYPLFFAAFGLASGVIAVVDRRRSAA